jgi:alkaline phosphatase D
MTQVLQIFTFALALLALSPASSGQDDYAAAKESRFRIALIGCHRQFNPAPALVRYLECRPDFAIWLGDNVYADTKDDVSYLEMCYAALEQKPAFQELRKRVPFAATWDDHDFGYNNDGKDYPLKKQSKELFRKFWKMEEFIPADRDGIYHARYLQVKDHDGREHTVQILLLDPRYNRDDPSEAGDTLGEPQWNWLTAELRKPAALRFVVSGFQVLLDRESGSETWAKFPQARERLFDTIRRSGAERVIFLTGDQHYGEVCRMRGVLDYDAVELQFCGVNQREDPEFNSYRVGQVADAKHSYAYLDIQMGTNDFDLPHVQFTILDAQKNVPELTYRVRLDELEVPVSFGGETRFLGQNRVTLRSEFPHLEIRYTTDGATPTAKSKRYVEPLLLERTTLVKARLFDPAGWARGPVCQQQFQELEHLPGRELLRVDPGLRYQYFEGEFSRVPDFASLMAKKQGIAKHFNVKRYADRADKYALLFQGYLRIDEPGLYELATRSDDGSVLHLHDMLVVDNDGSHSRRWRSGRVALAAGWHPLRIGYFEDYMSQTMRVYMRRPGEVWQRIDWSRLGHD